MSKKMKKMCVKARDKGSQFERVIGTGGASEGRKRDAELELLRPLEVKKVPKIYLPKHTNELDERTVLIVFRDTAQMQLIGNLFTIRQSISSKTYITNINLLETIAKNVRDGVMRIFKGQIVLSESVEGEVDDEVVDEEEAMDGEIDAIWEPDPESLIAAEIEIPIPEEPKVMRRRRTKTVAEEPVAEKPVAEKPIKPKRRLSKLFANKRKQNLRG